MKIHKIQSKRKKDFLKLVVSNLLFFINRKLNFIDMSYIYYKGKFLNRSNKVLIFIIGFYVLNEFFEKRFDLYFKTGIYFLLVIFIYNVVMYMFNFINHFFQKIKHIIKVRI